MSAVVRSTVEVAVALVFILLLVVRELLRADDRPVSAERQRRLTPITVVVALAFAVVIGHRLIGLAQ